MTFEDLVSSDRLREEKTSKEQLIQFIQFAENEISAAKFILSRFPLTAYKSAYDALIHAGNALIRHYGYRPTTKYTHSTITEFVHRIFGKEYAELVGAFKRMRRKRHPLLYEARFMESEKEIKQNIEKAEQLVCLIEEHIKIKPAQGMLI